MHFVKRQGKVLPAVLKTAKWIRPQNTGCLHAEPVGQINITLQVLHISPVEDGEELRFNSGFQAVFDGVAGACMTPLHPGKIVVHLGTRAKDVNEENADADLIESAGQIARYERPIRPNLDEDGPMQTPGKTGSPADETARPLLCRDTPHPTRKSHQENDFTARRLAQSPLFRRAVRITMLAEEIAGLGIANRKLQRLLERIRVLYGCHHG